MEKISGTALGMARIVEGLSRDELAARLGVSVRTVANWENNGVPAHRTALVHMTLGSAVRAALDAEKRQQEYEEWSLTPEAQERLEQEAQSSHDRRNIISFRRVDSNNLAKALSNFTVEELLSEALRRIRNLSPMEFGADPSEELFSESPQSPPSNLYDLVAHPPLDTAEEQERQAGESRGEESQKHPEDWG